MSRAVPEMSSSRTSTLRRKDINPQRWLAAGPVSLFHDLEDRAQTILHVKVDFRCYIPEPTKTRGPAIGRSNEHGPCV